MLIILQCTECTFANDRLLYGSARSQALAGSMVMLSGENAFMGNHAGLAAMPGLSLGVHYENCFMVPELGWGAFYCGLPVKTGVFGFAYSTLGNLTYREGQACLSFGKTFGAMIRAGIGMHYLWIRQPADLGNLSAIIPALGIQVIPAPGMTIGFQVFNPAAQQFVPEGYVKIPVILQAGLGFHLGDEVLLCFEARKQSPDPITYHGGIEINIRKQITGRFGISSGKFPGYAFGFGFNFRPLTVDIAATHHPVLGFSPSVTITYAMTPGKKKNRKEAH